MKLSKRILSVILTLAMLITAMPMVVGAEDNYVELFMADIDGATTFAETGMNIDPVGANSTRTNAIVNAKTEGIDDEGAYGDVLKFGADVAVTNMSNDNYMLIPYTAGKAGILEGVSALKLEDMKASMDMYLPSESLNSFYVRFYDTTVTTKGESLMDVAKENDGEGGYYPNAKFLNNNKLDAGRALPVDRWFNIEFAFDFANDKYDVYLDGEQIINDYALATLVGDLHINSFGPRAGGSANGYTLYFDNIAVYHNDADIVIERDVYEPEYNLNLFTADFTASSLANAGISAGSNAKPDCGIVSAADLDLDENGARDNIAKLGKLADETNQNSYFMITATTGTYKPLENWVKYMNMLQNTELSFDMYMPSATSKGFSLQLYDRGTGDGIGGTQAHSEYIAYFVREVDESENVTVTAKFTDAGVQQTTGASIPLDRWFNISVRCNFVNDTYDVYLDGELIVDDFAFVQPTKDANTGAYGSNGMGGDYIMNSMAIRVVNTKDAYAMYLDNVEINAIDPYSVTIAELNFDDVAAGTVFSASNNPDNKLFFSTGVTLAVEKDSTTGSNIGLISSATGATQFVAFADNYTSDNFQSKYGYCEYPDVIKVSFDMKKKSSTTAAYCWMGDSTPAQWTSLLMMWGSSDTKFNREKNTVTTAHVGTGVWRNVEMYINFVDKKYTIYVDGNFVGKTDLPSESTNLNFLGFATNGVANNACIDNVRISAPAPYSTKNIINYVDYTTDSTGAISGDVLKTGYVLNNAEDTAFGYKIIEAKYNAADDSLVSVTLADGSVGANSLELKNLATKPATSEYYYQYFIWSDVDDEIKPLFENWIAY